MTRTHRFDAPQQPTGSKRIQVGHGFSLDRCLQSLEKRGVKLDPSVAEMLRASADQGLTGMVQALSSRLALSPRDLHRALADGLGVPFVDMDWIRPETGLLHLLPLEDWRRHAAFPLSRVDNTLEIAMGDPSAPALPMHLENKSGLSIVRMYAMPGQIEAYLTSAVIDAAEVQQSLADMDEAEIDLLQAQIKAGNTAGIIPFGQHLIALAHKLRASDIHIEPIEYWARVRLRVDGSLHEALVLDLRVASALISYFKVGANLDITERRLPQDGRMTGHIGGMAVDLRISSVPVLHGEKLCIRVLDSEMDDLSLANLGFSDRTLPAMRQMLRQPHGLILVTGPTGSGKTTTLYAAIADISRPDVNITTIEDPVEYDLGGINQIQVHTKVGLDFPRVLRSVLRQDPDIILVGEMRDTETASIAVRAALTGHLVLSTLHTNSALEATTRLIDMEVPPFLISQALAGAVSQRLVRRLCQHCKTPFTADEHTMRALGAHNTEPLRFFQANGCDACNGSGYRGRIAVHSVFTVDDTMARLIADRAPIEALQRSAADRGFRPISHDAIVKALCGLTSVEEVLAIHDSRNLI